MLRTILTYIETAIFYAVTAILPEKTKRKVGKNCYDRIYEAYGHNIGPNAGRVEVFFECPYAGHVAAYIKSPLSNRVADETDVTADYSITNNGDTYTLTVDVLTSEERPECIADASAMTLVLCLPTLIGDTPRTTYRIINVEENEKG